MGDDPSVFRTTVRIPTASGDDLEAWVYQPDGHGPHPAVVMAHGFAGVKAGGLEPFAERFCREGFTAIAFDYRHWGGSSGEPREVTSIPRQREDYRTVIDWAAANPDIDAQRIFIWGTSFSGMHVGEIAATDVRLRGAIAQCPLVGRPPIYITESAAPGEFGAIASGDAIAGLSLITPPKGTDWHNRVAARSLCSVSGPTDRSGRQPTSVAHPNDRGGDRHNRESVRRCASLIARQRVSSTAAEAVTMALTRAARTTTTWCVSKSNSCIDTRRFRRQAERLRWPKVRRAVRGRELERSSSVGRPLVLVGTRCEAEV